MTAPDIANNFSAIRQRIGAAAQAAGRKPQDVRLIAVSKMQDIDAIRAAMAAGQLVFGENRVQEAKRKFAPLREEAGSGQGPELELHLIGPLQTNKADDAVKLFDVIQTLDRPELAKALAKSIGKIGRTPKLYIEVNIGNEPQKAGIAPDALPEFLDYCVQECGLTISGLMCIPPQGGDAAPYFRELKNYADQFSLPHISMGMSADFEIAIACGATEVRIGTALFGNRG
jgi:pyridoxal phosphate enzyme (YggS family)